MDFRRRRPSSQTLDVDWATSRTGPADFDAGHCRLNLAALFGADWAERLRVAYEAEAGRAIPRGMTSRVEDLLEATLGRL